MSSGRANDDLEVDLPWYKDSKGYALENHGKFGLWIGRRGGELVQIYPLRNDLAFKAFSSVATPKELVEFMNNYGFLNNIDGVGPVFMRSDKKGKLFAIRGAPEPDGEDVHAHLEAAGAFREILNAKPRGGFSKKTAALLENECREGIGEIQMLFDKRGSPRPVLKPTSLMSGLVWQLVNSVRAGVKYRLCRECGVIFQVGPASGRRADAKFCSDEHRTLFNSRRRSR
jgi:hypothetical protein